MGLVLGGITIGLLALGGFLGISVLTQNFRKVFMKEETKARRGTNLNSVALADYNEYHLKFPEKVFYTVLAAIGLFALCYIFYKSIWFSLTVTPLALLYPSRRARAIRDKRKKELNIQFKDALYALSSSLMAGKSVESAFKDVHQDLLILYPDPETPIIKEVEYILRRLEMNETLEEAMSDFARRSHSEDIRSFVDVFSIAKRSGGNLVEIIKNTSTIIADKLQIEQEIDTLLAQRKLEQKILAVMPIALIMLLSWSTGNYMAPVFDTIAGRIAMTAAVFLLGVANIIASRIMQIEV